MSELLLQEILHEVKGMRGDIQILNNRIGNIEERMTNMEKRMSKVEGRISVMEEKIAIIEENLKETKSICEAVRHGQDVLNAKYDALSLDVHEMKRKIVHITNTLEMKVLPSLTDHESGIQVLNTRVFKVESTLQRLTHTLQKIPQP
jgi:chromosome segregation ATPase